MEHVLNFILQRVDLMKEIQVQHEYFYHAFGYTGKEQHPLRSFAHALHGLQPEPTYKEKAQKWLEQNNLVMEDRRHPEYLVIRKK